MLSALEQSRSRREFFRFTARSGGLAAVGLLFAWLNRPRSGEICVSNGICPGCAAFSNCGLPTALSAKAARSKPVAADVRRLTSTSAQSGLTSTAPQPDKKTHE